MAGMPEMMRYTDITRTKATATSPQKRNSARMTNSIASLTPRFASMRSAACPPAGAAVLVPAFLLLDAVFTLPLSPFGVMT